MLEKPVNVEKINKLTLDVDAARTTQFRLDWTYYAIITFTDADGEVLNEVYVPFTLSIPALSDFLVKEQVVFGGTTTGKAYLNVEDATYPAGNAIKVPRYEFYHAFKNFNDAVSTLGLEFELDANQKIGGTVVKDNLARLGSNGVSIVLIDTEKAYHQPINVKIKAAKYLDLYEYYEPERNANAFALDVMSPIEQGNVVAANGTGISVVATADGVAKVYDKDFKATTYAGIAYKLFKDAEFVSGNATKFTSKYLSSVVFASANNNVFTVPEEGVAATKDGEGKITEGYLEITPANAGYEATEKLNVTVTDIWGKEKKVSINVTVKPSNN